MLDLPKGVAAVDCNFTGLNLLAGLFNCHHGFLSL